MAEGQQCTAEEGGSAKNMNVGASGVTDEPFERIENLHTERGEIAFIPRCYDQSVNSSGCGDHCVFKQIIWPSVH